MGNLLDGIHSSKENLRKNIYKEKKFQILKDDISYNVKIIQINNNRF